MCILLAEKNKSRGGIWTTYYPIHCFVIVIMPEASQPVLVKSEVLVKNYFVQYSIGFELFVKGVTPMCWLIDLCM